MSGWGWFLSSPFHLKFFNEHLFEVSMLFGNVENVNMFLIGRERKIANKWKGCHLCLCLLSRIRTGIYLIRKINEKPVDNPPRANTQAIIKSTCHNNYCLEVSKFTSVGIHKKCSNKRMYLVTFPLHPIIHKGYIYLHVITIPQVISNIWR